MCNTILRSIGWISASIRTLTGTLILLPLLSYAQPVSEYDLKAAFVYNFMLFTDWPANTVYESGTLNICVHPSSALHQSLAALNGKSMKGRKLSVRHLIVADGARGCHVLLIDGDRDRWSRIRQGLVGASVLTIDDDEAPGHDGGSVISLFMDANRIVFDVDMEAARQAKLTLSSKLLRLARKVR